MTFYYPMLTIISLFIGIVSINTALHFKKEKHRWRWWYGIFWIGIVCFAIGFTAKIEVEEKEKDTTLIIDDGNVDDIITDQKGIQYLVVDGQLISTFKEFPSHIEINDTVDVYQSGRVEIIES